VNGRDNANWLLEKSGIDSQKIVESDSNFRQLCSASREWIPMPTHLIIAGLVSNTGRASGLQQRISLLPITSSRRTNFPASAHHCCPGFHFFISLRPQL